MLHTPVNIGQSAAGPAARVVDAEAALEFMKEATKVATGTELEDIGQRLELKSALFGELLAEERLETFDEEDLKCLLRHIFTLKRKAKRLLRRNDLVTIRQGFQDLLYGSDAIAERFDRFTAGIQGFEPAMKVSLASEVLHFTDPGSHWLWTYWIWNPKTSTGALPLVTHQEGVDLSGTSAGVIYDQVGQALVQVNQAGHEVGYSRSGRGLFGTDVFLACVYAVYMFTVFKVKLSQEFNRILPELPQLVERVLGVHAMGEADAGETNAGETNAGETHAGETNA